MGNKGAKKGAVSDYIHILPNAHINLRKIFVFLLWQTLCNFQMKQINNKKNQIKQNLIKYLESRKVVFQQRWMKSIVIGFADLTSYCKQKFANLDVQRCFCVFSQKKWCHVI